MALDLDFDTAKLLAVIGLVLSLVGGYSAALGIVGVVLYLIGMYSISQHYRDGSIFTYALIASVGVAVAAVIAGIVLFSVFFAALSVTGSSSLGLAAVVAGFLVLVGAAVALGYYKKKLMERLGPHAGDPGLAGLAAKLYWYGGLLSIILVGFILILVAEILEIIVVWGLRPPAAGARPSALQAPGVGQA